MADDEREPDANTASHAPGSAQLAGNAGEPRAPQSLAFAFTGTAAEYFRIWVVNTCLSLLTLGVFSAWAKVRKKRYLYSHTLLDGTPFEYLGRPLPILKGRLVAAVLFAAWYVATHFVTALLPAAALAGLVLAPWVMVQSLAFNARYSAYRNMSFRFDGRYWGAARVIYTGLLLMPFTLGLYYPVWKQRLQRFAGNHSIYGGVSANSGANASDYFAIHFAAGLIVGSILAGVSVVVGLFLDRSAVAGYAAVALWVGYLVGTAYIRAHLDSLVWQHLSLGPLRFRYELSAKGLLALYVTNLLAIGLSLGLLIPWATIRTARYRAARFKVMLNGTLSQFQAKSAPAVRAAGAELGEFFDLDFSL